MKTYRTPKAKPGQLKVAYGRQDKHNSPELIYAYDNSDRAAKGDAYNILYFFNHVKDEHGKSLLEDLEQRGYDLTTLKLTIEKKK
jgi:hypothetical protein